MRRNASLIIFSVFIFLMSCKKQDCEPAGCTDVPFNKVYGGSQNEGAMCIITPSNGGYLFAGWTISQDGNITGAFGREDAWVVKLNCKGNIEWKKNYGGSSSDGVQQIIETKDGGYLFAGDTYSFDGDAIGNHGGSDAWLVKLKSDGSKIWQKTFGDGTNDFAASVVAAPGGGYVALINVNEDISPKVWLLKIDENGNQLWRTIVDGSHFETGIKVIASNDNGYIFVGTGSIGGSGSALVVKLDANGTMLWEKTYGGSNTDQFKDIIRSQDGGYTITGLTNSFDGDVIGKHRGVESNGVETTDVWVVKINENGNIIWQKPLGGTNNEQGYAIFLTTAGKYLIAGNAESNDGDVTGNHGSYDAWVAELDGTGNLLWQKSYGGTGTFGESFNSITKAAGADYIAAGASFSSDGDINGNHGMEDVWITTITR